MIMRRFLIFLARRVSKSFWDVEDGEGEWLTGAVAGHAGKLVFGLLGQKIPAVLMVGRAQ
jgi:hypothetical protein